MNASTGTEKDNNIFGVWKTIEDPSLILVVHPSDSYTLCAKRITRIYWTEGYDTEEIIETCIEGSYEYSDDEIDLCFESDLDNPVRDVIGYHGPLSIQNFERSYLELNAGWRKLKFVKFADG